MQKRLCALTAAVFLAGFAAGSGYTGLKSRAAPAAFRREQAGSKRIAVVNLDNGIRQAGKRIYYAADAMEFPDADFISVSAREAELGLESGYYAAALTIPGDFSEQADSLARVPGQASLRYTVSAELTAEERADVQRRIGSFGERMNRNMVYLYFHAILGEFHAAQDAVRPALENHALALQELGGLNPEQWMQEALLPTEPEEARPSRRAVYTTAAYEALRRELDREEALLFEIAEEQARLEAEIARFAEAEALRAESRTEAAEALYRELSETAEREAADRSRITLRLASASDAEILKSERYLKRTASASNALFLASASDALPETERSAWRAERRQLASASDATRAAFAALQTELEELPAFPEAELRKRIDAEVFDASKEREERLADLRRQSERLSRLSEETALANGRGGERRLARRDAVRAVWEERDELLAGVRAEEQAREEERKQSRAYGALLREALRDAELKSGTKAKEAVERLKENGATKLAENRRLFGSFTERLPHTRNGSLPNKASYEKMAAPLCLIEEGKTERTKADRVATESIQSGERRAEALPLRQLLFAGLALSAGAGIGLITGRRR